MASDDFNRADGSLGSNWTDQTTGSAAARILSNRVEDGPVAPDGSFGYWSGSAISDDNYSQLTITSSADGYAGPTTRCSGTGGSRNAYIGMVLTANRARLYKVLTGAGFPGTLIASNDSISTSDGDTFKIEASGSALTMSQNGGAISGLSGVTDSSLSTGDPGLFVFAPKVDDWQGADLSPPPVTPTVFLLVA